MEMPEGWNRWKNNTNLLPDDMAVWITKGEKDFVADLMKEMAEALEYITSNSNFDLRDFVGADEILKKFKEWK